MQYSTHALTVIITMKCSCERNDDNVFIAYCFELLMFCLCDCTYCSTVLAHTPSEPGAFKYLACVQYSTLALTVIITVKGCCEMNDENVFNVYCLSSLYFYLSDCTYCSIAHTGSELSRFQNFVSVQSITLALTVIIIAK